MTRDLSSDIAQSTRDEWRRSIPRKKAEWVYSPSKKHQSANRQRRTTSAGRDRSSFLFAWCLATSTTPVDLTLRIFGRKSSQQSAESYFPVGVDSDDCERFNAEIWPSLTYRFRCRVWSFWQKHLKDWWFFIRYPLAYGTALALAIATIYHLSLSHPSPSP